MLSEQVVRDFPGLASLVIQGTPEDLAYLQRFAVIHRIIGESHEDTITREAKEISRRLRMKVP